MSKIRTFTEHTDFKVGNTYFSLDVDAQPPVDKKKLKERELQHLVDYRNYIKIAHNHG